MNNSELRAVGILGFLALVFVGLKLTGVIQWSWLWVLAPVWIPSFFMISVVFIATPFILMIARYIFKK